MKSFYNFLVDWGPHCLVSRFFCREGCSKKITHFNWLAWKNKILTLENLEKKRCNRMPTATCVVCHSDIESGDHLFIQCSFACRIWDYIISLLHLPEPPALVKNLWDSWRISVRQSQRDMSDIVIKAIVWNVWLTRNDYIFNANVLHVYSVIIKIDCMILSWCSSVGDRSQEKTLDSLTSIRHSLEFLRPRAEERVENSAFEEFQEQTVG